VKGNLSAAININNFRPINWSLMNLGSAPSGKNWRVFQQD
jgi:hypothetical protein